jgi:hypothetical protein
MKPFDLKAALSGAKVVTRDGREVKIAGYNEDAKSEKEKIIGWVEGIAFGWQISGELGKGGINKSYDLFMSPTERTEYIVRFEYTRDNYRAYGPYSDLQTAEKIVRMHGGTIHEIKIIE